MGAGRLDRKIDIERKSVTQNAFGEEVEAWTKIAARRSAGYRALSGDERFTSAQFVARQQVEFRVRKSAVLADLSPLDRIIYPASTDADSPGLEPQIYDIMDVAEIVRGRTLLVKAARRAETV